MIFVLFTENGNTYDDVVRDLQLQKHNTGKSTKIGHYTITKGYINVYDTETNVAMISASNTIDISRTLNRPIIYNPDCTKYGFHKGDFDGVVIVLNEDTKLYEDNVFTS